MIGAEQFFLAAERTKIQGLGFTGSSGSLIKRSEIVQVNGDFIVARSVETFED